MDLKDIRKIIELMKSNELTEFEMAEDQFRIAIKRGSGEVAQSVVMQAAPAIAPAPDAAQAPASAPAASAAPESGNAEEAGWIDIVSPIVGTYYRSPSPEAGPFVSVGDEVTEDTVVCIVEAMKVMNEIKADVKGVIRKVLLENGSPVEYGQVVYKVDPR